MFLIKKYNINEIWNQLILFNYIEYNFNEIFKLINIMEFLLLTSNEIWNQFNKYNSKVYLIQF